MNKISVVVLSVLLSGAAVAGNSPLSPSLYYEMGGGTSFERPLNTQTAPPDLKIPASNNHPLNCDIWDKKILDMKAYPKLIEDYMRGQLDQLGQTIVAQLTAFGQGLAVAALQRALPGMYSYSQTLTSQISRRVGIAKRTCSDVVNDINHNINPLDGWRKVGLGRGWRSTLNDSELVFASAEQARTYNGPENTSILAAEEDIAENARNEPIPWFGDQLAGDSLNPILVTRDLVSAGYNVFESDAAAGATDLINNQSAAGDTVQVESIRGTQTLPKRLGELFDDTNEAVEWAQRMIGEQEIYTCEGEPGCTSLFTPGVGLAVLVGEEVEELTSAWVALIADPLMPTIEQLTTVSSAKVQMTSFVYEALLEFPVQDQNVYIGRLIDDVALSRTVEKAMAIRRMIIVSSESPVVGGYVKASGIADKIVTRIKAEIDDLVWGVQTQKLLASHVSSSILSYDAVRDTLGSKTVTGIMKYGTESSYSDRPVKPTP